MTLNCFMHPRNIYRTRPDFKHLASEYPEFSDYAIVDERGRVHVNFKDANTLRCLTRTLLKKDFGLTITIPENCLIPTVPQRLNYILWIEDLISTFPGIANSTVKGIDIGTGPCCIFSVLGARKNGWKFLSTESEDESLKWADKNVADNNLQDHIKLLKVTKEVILKGVADNEPGTFDFCMCNPPFFHDIHEMRLRKKTGDTSVEMENEVMVNGGEVEFVRRMILDSVELKEKIKVYTSMLGKKRSLTVVKNELKKLDNVNYTLTEFCQGNTMRWGVAWTFVEGINIHKIQCSLRKKKKKPLNFLIPKIVKGYSIKKMLERVTSILNELKIQYEIQKETRLNVVLLVRSDENTWSHQRRRRRQALQEAKKDCESKTEGAKVEPDTLEISSGAMERLGDSQVCGDERKGDCFENELETPMDISLTDEDDSKVKSAIAVHESRGLVKNESSDQSGCDWCCGQSSQATKRVLEQENEDCDVKRSKMESAEQQGAMRVLADDVPLLLCDLELKRHCDKIMLEMNCEDHCNRQSMSEVLQLLKNRLQ